MMLWVRTFCGVWYGSRASHLQTIRPPPADKPSLPRASFDVVVFSLPGARRTELARSCRMLSEGRKGASSREKENAARLRMDVNFFTFLPTTYLPTYRELHSKCSDQPGVHL